MRLLRAVYPLLVGMLLGAMQTGLFLQLSFTLSSSFGTYLMVTLSWLIGSAIGVYFLTEKAWSLKLFLLVMLVSYGIVSLLLWLLPFRSEWWVLYAALVVTIGFYPGVFFGRMGAVYSARVLFFRENNGFIIGLLGTTLLFMMLGRSILWLMPIVLVLILFLMPTMTAETVSE